MHELSALFPDVDFVYAQSNIEGEIINKLQELGFTVDGIILNAGAYTHTSVAIGDAVRAIPAAVIEVHMSNVFSREEFRHISYIAPHARGVISGFGMKSYLMAVQYFLEGKRD
jgi:3-dehydroquinate dehydratase-2